MAEKQLIDGAWYWVRFETGFKDEWTQAPAMYKSGGDAWYSFAFAGIPARKVEVLGKIDAPAPAEPAASATPAVCDSVHIDDFGKVATPEAKAEVQAEPVIYVSHEQLENFANPTHSGGHYLPVRRTPLGLLSYPLYTAPQATQPGVDARDAKRLDWILRQGDEFSCHVIQDAPGDGDYWVTGMKSSGQHKDPRAAIDAAMAAKEL